jgi:predicted aspartyl protease
MGITLLTVRIANPADEARAVDVECVVDSGALFAIVPGRILRAIGIRPTRSEQFTLADGSHVRRRIGNALFALGDRSAASPVIFGEPGDAAVMGAVTLETLGLMLDPLKRELRPLRALTM